MARNKISLILGENEKVEGKYGDNMNTLIVAPPGGGKTFSVVSPNISDNNGCSMFIDDKKGNLYYKHKKELQEAGYKVYCFNLIDFTGLFQYNPFSSLETRDDIHRLVNFLIPDEKKGKDPYWIDSSRELAETLIDILMLTDYSVSFENLISLLHKTGTQYKARGVVETPVPDDVDELIDVLKNMGKKCVGMERYKSLRSNSSDTWKCVRSSCIASLSAYDSDKLFSKTNKTTMDFTQMATEKVALFVTSSDVNNAFDPVIQLMYRDIVYKLIEYADTNCVKRGSMLPRHVRFILDDFASGAVMPGFERIIANCRSRNISFLLCVQSLTQLRGIYKDMTEAVLDCINTRVYFSNTNLGTQQYMSVIMDVPLSEIQELGVEDICIEQINHKPRFARRYQVDRITKRKRKI